MQAEDLGPRCVGSSMTHRVWRRTVRIWRLLDRFEGGSRQVRGAASRGGGELGVALKVEGGAGREDDSCAPGRSPARGRSSPPSIGEEASHGLPAIVDPLADAERRTCRPGTARAAGCPRRVAERRGCIAEDATEAVVEALRGRPGRGRPRAGRGWWRAMIRTSTGAARAAADALDLAPGGRGGARPGSPGGDRRPHPGRVPAVGQLEAADPPGEGAGEGAFVAEQLALDQSREQGGAVELDQRLGRAAVRVDRPRSAPCRSPSRR